MSELPQTAKTADMLPSAECRVSVIIPAYRAMATLGRCLDALAGQCCADIAYEVIIVDNGGNEGLAALLSGYAFARAVTEPMPGSYAARNAGIAAANGEVLAFTDADCVPDPQWLAAGVAALHTASDIGLVGGRIRLMLPDLPEHAWSAAMHYQRYVAFDQRSYIQQKHFAATANMFTTRKVLDDVGGFDQRLYSGGDLEFGNRVARRGHRLVYADDAIVRHEARASLRELIDKARRLAGGEVMLLRTGQRRHSLRGWLNVLLPPVVLSLRLASLERVSGSWRSRWLAIGVVNLLHLVALLERIGIYLGRTPRR
jgi:GT2 family glycosyltransferase